MTELKHGSNVAMLQTTSTFDVATDEWIITTPNEGAASLPLTSISCTCAEPVRPVTICHVLTTSLTSCATATCRPHSVAACRQHRCCPLPAPGRCHPPKPAVLAPFCDTHCPISSPLFKQPGTASGAIKWWIGNAAEDGKWATVFARLRLPADGGKGVKDHGVHAFICRIRNDNGSLCKGVEIRDCGYKVGLNGIDNGAIAFHDVRIPRENLLDKFASVRSPLPPACPTLPRPFFTTPYLTMKQVKSPRLHRVRQIMHQTSHMGSASYPACVVHRGAAAAAASSTPILCAG